MRYVKYRKIIRDLWQNRSRTSLVVLSIAVGVFAFGTIAGTRTTILRELNAAYLAINPASAILTIDPFDDALIDSIERMPEVAAADGRRIVRLRQQVAPNQWQDIELYAIDDFESMEISVLSPEAGVWPPPDNTALIERKALAETGVSIGEAMMVELPGGKQRQLPVSGLVHDISKPPTAILGFAYGYISNDTLTWLGLPSSFNTLQITVADHSLDEAHITQVAEAVADKVERSGRTVYRTEIPTPGQHPAEEIIPTILLILGMLGVLSLILSGFLVVNTISAILMQQRQQIGVMKAIGAQTNHIVRVYGGMVLVFGLVALLVSIPLGMLGSRGLTGFIADQLNVDIVNYAIPPGLVALEVTVGLLVPILASLFPVLSTARLTVREALTSYGLGQGQFGRGLIDQLLIGLRTVLAISRPLMISLRNTFRRKGRLALTLFTLVLGGAIFISVLTVRASLLNTLDQSQVQNRFDISVELTRPYRIAAATRAIENIPGVTRVEGWDSTVANRVRPDASESDNLIIIAPPADTIMLQLDIVEGRWLQADDENAIVIDESLLRDEPDLKLGEMITLDIGDEESQWRIVGLSSEFRPPLAPAKVYINYPYFAEAVGGVGRTTSLRVATENHSALAQSTIASKLEARFADLGIQISDMKTQADDRAIVTERFNILTALLLFMSMLMAIVGGLGLTGTMSINVIERVREIGVMRAIGASNGAVIRLVMVEGILVGWLSWFFGGLLSLPLSRLMSFGVGTALLQRPLDYAFSIPGLLIWLATVVIIAALASFVPAWNASRLTVREVLAYE